MRRTGRVLSAAVVAAGIATVLGAGFVSAEVLGPRELVREMRANEALRRHVRDRGLPDLAQRWDLQASWPWQSYIVRLFYLEPRTEIAFSRAFVLDRPEVGLMRYRRPISDEVAAELRRFLAKAPGVTEDDLGPATDEPTGRAETAARRAEVAAEMTELGAAAAEEAAKHLESVATEVESSFQKQLQK